ncbi:MAG: hypothetical protein PHE06_12875 [Lachnospiraceae bacterium]|nr:hypothetical protein [Lachnospiraceae bacterium]MDD3796830.1 hypothetical protein [Lachnospiraceae bacterium]
MEAYDKMLLRDQKQKIWQDYNLADAIVSRIFREKETDIIYPWDTYPKLFQDEKELFDQQKEFDELEKFKAKRRRFAAEHNQGGGGVIE